MLGSLLITLREGLEAAIIISMVLAYLSATNNRKGFKPVWAGAALAYIGYLSFSLVAYFWPSKFMKEDELKESVKHHVYVEVR